MTENQIRTLMELVELKQRELKKAAPENVGGAYWSELEAIYWKLGDLESEEERAELHNQA